MNGKKINEVLGLNAKHALYFHRGDWYHHLRRFPGILIDSNGYIRFKTEKEFINSKYIKLGKRVNIYGGISNIMNYF